MRLLTHFLALGAILSASTAAFAEADVASVEAANGIRFGGPLALAAIALLVGLALFFANRRGASLPDRSSYAASIATGRPSIPAPTLRPDPVTVRQAPESIGLPVPAVSNTITPPPANNQASGEAPRSIAPTPSPVHRSYSKGKKRRRGRGRSRRGGGGGFVGGGSCSSCSSGSSSSSCGSSSSSSSCGSSS